MLSTALDPSSLPPTLLDRTETLTGALERLAHARPEFNCLTIVGRGGTEQRLTLGLLWQRAQHVRAALEARGLAPRRSVLLILPTGPELVAAYFGAMLAGNVPALLAGPTNRFADADTYVGLVRALVDNADAVAIYAGEEVAALLRPALDWAGPILTPGDIGDDLPTSPAPAIADSAVATMQYSSGSTGIPKGVLLTHRAMLNNIRAVREGLALTPRDVSVNWIPLYHDMGLIDAFLLPLLSGCPTVLMPTTDFMRDPSQWLRAIHRYGGTISWAPNFAYALCANRLRTTNLDGLDLSTWRLAINAAEPVLPETVEAFARRFAAYGFRPEAMTPAWGLAENVTLATCHPIDQAPVVETLSRVALERDGVARPIDGDGVRSVAIGRCLPRCHIQVRAASGAPLSDRDVGTIWLRSDCLFDGYHRDPEQTARVRVDGWLNTGDRGYLADGDLYFVSREKDLIVIGGEKYSPHSIESLINKVPGVRAGCTVVFGVLDVERGTEEAVAVVETREGGTAARTAMQEAIGRETLLQAGLSLRHVILVPPGGVQKTTSGKLARDATRRRWLHDIEELRAGAAGAE